MASIDGLIFANNRWLVGRLDWQQGAIVGIDGTEGSPETHPDLPRIVPGFIDLHVHGGGGADAMDGEDAVRRTAAFHGRRGTAAMAPTTMTAPAAAIERALSGIEAVRTSPDAEGAAVVGAHLEGPFINPQKLGAQPPYTQEPDADLAAHWDGLCPLKVATLAPELPGADALIARLGALGCRVQMGHSLADAATAARAFDAGVAGATHLFNAMSGLDHRAPGVAAAALAHARHAEIILDLQHVAPTMIRVACRAIPDLYAITDATAAAGMPDGSYMLGETEVSKSGDTVWATARSATLAGSALTMDRAFANLIAIGIDPAVAVAMTSTRAADYLGLRNLGRLQPGAEASFAVLDHDWQLRTVYLRGRENGPGD